MDINIEISKKFYNTVIAKNLSYYNSFNQKNKIYCDSGFSAYGIKNNNPEKNSIFFNKIKKLWEDKDILIVCGKTIFDNIEHNIFDNSKSLDYVYASSKNAFEEYDRILREVKEKGKNKLILIILGPTASVLAFDLAENGFNAIDIGHVAKDYDWFVKNKKRGSSDLIDFFNPD